VADCLGNAQEAFMSGDRRRQALRRSYCGFSALAGRRSRQSAGDFAPASGRWASCCTPWVTCILIGSRRNWARELRQDHLRAMEPRAGHYRQNHLLCNSGFEGCRSGGLRLRRWRRGRSGVIAFHGRLSRSWIWRASMWTHRDNFRATVSLAN